jgi:hypothetical protein
MSSVKPHGRAPPNNGARRSFIGSPDAPLVVRSTARISRRLKIWWETLDETLRTSRNRIVGAPLLSRGVQMLGRGDRKRMAISMHGP